MGDEGTSSQSTATYTHRVDRFKRQCNKSFTGNPFFGEDLSDRIHKRVQVFLISCNTACLDNVDMGALSDSDIFSSVYNMASE